MEVRNLEYFLEVARTKSFTKAAQNLFITQPTISRMIKNLEDELEVELFERLGKGVELTDAGQTILLQAQNIVNSVRGLSSDLSDVMQLKKGQINIGLPPMIGANFFPRVVGEFNKIYPRIKVHLWEHGAKKVEDDVAAGRLEIGVTLLPESMWRIHRTDGLAAVSVADPVLSYDLALANMKGYQSRSCLAWNTLAREMLGITPGVPS